jgi:hypothetical protein
MENITNNDKITDNKEWNESYYYVFYDKTQNIGGMTRLGFKPNKSEGMTFFFLFLPNGSTAGYFQETKDKNYPDRIKIGGMAHILTQEGINYKFNGNMIIVKNPRDLPGVRENPNLIEGVKKCEFNLEFNPINDVYEYSKYMTKESLELGKKAGDKHWEQIGEINGNIKFGDDIFKIRNILGQRDHTYGVRDWTGVGNWLYYVVWFNNKLCINPAAIIAEDGQLSTGGFLFKKDKNIPLKTIKVLDQKFEKNGIFPISSELEIIDYFDTKHILKAKVGPTIPVPFEDKQGNKSILIQSFGDFKLDDNSGGYGTFETLRRK